MTALVSDTQAFIKATKDVVCLREADLLLIIRPNKVQHVNETAFAILDCLYRKGMSQEETAASVASRYGVSPRIVNMDIGALLESIRAIMNEEYSKAPLLSLIEFDPHSIKLPVLSEIAVTYRCQNSCDFCYASSPYRGRDMAEMNTEQVKKVIDKIWYEAQVPTISFTGGEPTLRHDLPEMIRYADSLGMRTNLITNGIRCADRSYVRVLAEAGLKSAQVSLESHLPQIHDDITGNPGSWEKTVRGIENLKAAGIHTHTNTTICRKNRYRLIDLARFVKERFDAPYLSMNMIIATGIARDNENINIGYSSIGGIVDPVIAYCEGEGIRFVWYSPTPYCIFNPIDRGLGSKSCACIGGLLSVNPEGEILPCSSFERGIGSLLNQPFERIWNSDQALYWRERRYVPPVCKGCTYETMCGGACPLYWENAGSFREIEHVQKREPRIKNLLWNIEKRLRVRTKGVPGISSRRG